MGPDLSDGIIIEIDKQQGMIYIKNLFHDDMIVRGEIAHCQKGETFIVGEQVVYPFLHDEHLTVGGIYKESLFTNPATQSTFMRVKLTLGILDG